MEEKEATSLTAYEIMMNNFSKMKKEAELIRVENIMMDQYFKMKEQNEQELQNKQKQRPFTTQVKRVKTQDDAPDDREKVQIVPAQVNDNMRPIKSVQHFPQTNQHSSNMAVSTILTHSVQPVIDLGDDKVLDDFDNSRDPDAPSIITKQYGSDDSLPLSQSLKHQKRKKSEKKTSPGVAKPANESNDFDDSLFNSVAQKQRKAAKNYSNDFDESLASSVLPPPQQVAKNTSNDFDSLASSQAQKQKNLIKHNVSNDFDDSLFSSLKQKNQKRGGGPSNDFDESLPRPKSGKAAPQTAIQRTKPDASISNDFNESTFNSKEGKQPPKQEQRGQKAQNPLRNQESSPKLNNQNKENVKDSVVRSFAAKNRNERPIQQAKDFDEQNIEQIQKDQELQIARDRELIRQQREEMERLRSQLKSQGVKKSIQFQQGEVNEQADQNRDGKRLITKSQKLEQQKQMIELQKSQLTEMQQLLASQQQGNTLEPEPQNERLKTNWTGYQLQKSQVNRENQEKFEQAKDEFETEAQQIEELLLKFQGQKPVFRSDPMEEKRKQDNEERLKMLDYRMKEVQKSKICQIPIKPKPKVDKSKAVLRPQLSKQKPDLQDKMKVQPTTDQVIVVRRPIVRKPFDDQVPEQEAEKQQQQRPKQKENLSQYQELEQVSKQIYSKQPNSQSAYDPTNQQQAKGQPDKQSSNDPHDQQYQHKQQKPPKQQQQRYPSYADYNSYMSSITGLTSRYDNHQKGKNFIYINDPNSNSQFETSTGEIWPKYDHQRADKMAAAGRGVGAWDRSIAVDNWSLLQNSYETGEIPVFRNIEMMKEPYQGYAAFSVGEI